MQQDQKMRQHARLVQQRLEAREMKCEQMMQKFVVDVDRLEMDKPKKQGMINMQSEQGKLWKHQHELEEKLGDINRALAGQSEMQQVRGRDVLGQNALPGGAGGLEVSVGAQGALGEGVKVAEELGEEGAQQGQQQVGVGQPGGEDGMEVEDSGQEVKRGMTLEELRSNGVDELGLDDLPEAEAGIAQQ